MLHANFPRVKAFLTEITTVVRVSFCKVEHSIRRKNLDCLQSPSPVLEGPFLTDYSRLELVADYKRRKGADGQRRSRNY